MEPIGERLRAARERLGLTLDEVERATRIRSHHLQALERGDWEALPSPVQARGFLGLYADFLGLDTQAILLQFVGSAKKRRTRSPVPRPTPGTSASATVRTRRPRRLSVDLVVAALGSLAVLAVLVWGAGRVMAGLRQRTEADAAGSGLVIPTSVATATPTQPTSTAAPAAPAAPAETPSPTPTAGLNLGPSASVNLRLAVEKRAWVRVEVDGAEKFNGNPEPGQSLEFQGQKVIEVTTGNGGGVRVFFNGQDQGLMGDLGQALTRLWTLQGMVLPTATTTPTPTVTPLVSPTPTATPVPSGG